MKITLRKASVLQNSILECIKSIVIKTEIDLNEFQDIQNELSKARIEVVENFNRRVKLYYVLYNIRVKIGHANLTSGISDILTQSAYIDKQLYDLNEILINQEVTDVKIIQGQLDKIKNRTQNMYGERDIVRTSVLTQEDIKSYKTTMYNLKKQKQEMNDKILELNVKTEIELEENDINILKAENLL